MSGGDVTVAYEIASDDGMHNIVRRGEATAEQAYALFGASRCRRPASPAGLTGIASRAATRRARSAAPVTLPAPGSALERLRFGFVSCSNYEHGYFSAYRHLTEENPEFVLFLGDYIYETIEENRPIVRRH